MNTAISRALVERMAGRTVLVIGDLILDEYVWGDVRRISPEAPVPIVEVRDHTFQAGGAANVAANIAGLGGKARLTGIVGVDSGAEQLLSQLEHAPLDASGIAADSTRPTTTKTRIMAQNQQVARLDREMRLPIDAALQQRLLDWVERQLPDADACVLSDYGKGVVTPNLARAVIALAVQARKPVIVDPKCAECLHFRGASVVKPNLQEAERFLQREIGQESDFEAAGAELAAHLESTAVLITRGARGMSLFRRGCPVVHQPTVARKVFDVTGAGDTVVATLALALATDLSLEDAVTVANQAAGIVVGKLGTAIVSPEELAHSLSGE